MQLITLTTDFGTQDWFVGTMKGVILGIQPRATVVDITHGLPAGDIRAGAFALAASCRFFPRGAVHVAVVDPGVGSQRQAIAVQTANCVFIGPDNGVLSLALDRERIRSIHLLENEKYWLRPVSATFHGRDVFAPVAAHLSGGLDVRKVGPVLKDYVHLPHPGPTVRAGWIQGEVIYIDRFGNAITNIPNDKLAKGRWKVFARRKPICSIEPFYQSVRTGLPVAVPGSSGFLEIAVNGGHAALRFGLRPGSVVLMQRA